MKAAPFYGWVIVAVGWVLNALIQAGFIWGFTVFVGPLGEEFGWSRTAVTAAWVCSLGWGLLIAPWFGQFFDRFGPRWLLVLGGLSSGLGWMLIPVVSNYWAFLLLFTFGVGTGLNAALNVASISTIAQWFARRRSLAMGTFQTASGGAGLLLIPVLSALVDEWGWRSGAVTVGTLVLLSSIAALPFMRHRPEDFGQQPDGSDSVVPAMAARRPLDVLARFPLPRRAAPTSSAFTLAQALRTSTFWFFSGAIWLRYFGMGMSQVHFYPFVTGAGFSPGVAATVLSASLVVNIPFRIYIGWLGDIYEHRWLLDFCAVCGGIALFALTLAGAWLPPLIWVYPLLWGIGLAMLPLQSAWLGDTYGRRHYGAINAMSTSVTQSGRIAGALLAAVAYDALGSYTAVFTAGASGFFVGVLLLTLMPPVGPPRSIVRSKLPVDV